MLSRLKIDNFALIEHLDAEFSDGFTIITGQTGAGKSLILKALSLLQGERFDSGILKHNEGKAVVEGEFIISNPAVIDAVSVFIPDWDTSGPLKLRREVSSSGRSRAFIDDSPVTLQSMREVAMHLFDVHSQHQNLLLTDSHRQLLLIDAVADNSMELAEYQDEFRKYISLRQKHRTLKEEREKALQKEEILRFRHDILQKLRPKAGEFEELEKRLELLSGAEETRQRLSAASMALNLSENSALSLIETARSLIEQVNTDNFHSSDASQESLPDRLKNIEVELKDIAETVSDFAEEIDSEPGEMARIDARIGKYYDAMRRFKTNDPSQLVVMAKEVAESISKIDGSSGELADVEAEMKTSGAALKRLGASLSDTRKAAASKFAKKLLTTARPLGLENLKVIVEVKPSKYGIDGGDAVEILCAFNKNQEPHSVTGAASGGELARLSLAIKSILSDKLKIPQIVFDEVDTGVSGEIADKMGRMMADIAEKVQVIAVTHLPQVAAKGKIHFQVYKQDTDSRTTTHLRSLSDEERIDEIAKMLSGAEINEASILNASSLLNQNKAK